MILSFILDVGYTVLSIILVINFWILIGFGAIMVFESFDDDVKYYDVLMMAFTWPLAVVMMMAKQLHIKGKRKSK
ncbi:hypothetical protein KAR91_47835 [Candidatus Pacearchaeota archaeon]|nr:hypothetical protein [Candidatus Pacearchaeota archaeon]